jgi:uncharacterized membrane protein
MRLLVILAIISSTSLFASEIKPLQCFGTEPFWGVKIDNKGFVKLSSPADENGKFFSKSELINAEGTSSDFAFQIIAKNMAQESIKLNILKSECNDGMSDEIYPYSVMMENSGSLFVGCCK